MPARYTLIVGTKNLSSWSLRPYLAMRATGEPFKEVLIDLRKPDRRKTILKHSPAGKVPVLKITEDGKTLTVFDSLAICETLAERFPKAKLWPKDAAARAEARAISAAMHSGFPDLRQTLPMEFARRLKTPKLSKAVEEQIDEIQGYWKRALKNHGGKHGFLFGRFSIADCMYAPVVSRFVTYGIPMRGALKDYAERIMALPAMTDWGKAAEKEVKAGKG